MALLNYQRVYIGIIDYVGNGSQDDIEDLKLQNWSDCSSQSDSFRCRVCLNIGLTKLRDKMVGGVRNYLLVGYTNI